MSDYREMAHKMLEADEGVRPEPYCDLCGKPWRECMYDRETWLIDIDFSSSLDSIFMLREMAAYGVCPGGKITIAIGRNLEDRPLLPKEIRALTEWDLIANENIACGFFGDKYFWKLSPERRAVLLCLAHWGGLEGASRFRKISIGAINSTHYSVGEFYFAADELLWKDGKDHSKGRSGWWGINSHRITEYARIWREG